MDGKKIASYMSSPIYFIVLLTEINLPNVPDHKLTVWAFIIVYELLPQLFFVGMKLYSLTFLVLFNAMKNKFKKAKVVKL